MTSVCIADPQAWAAHSLVWAAFLLWMIGAWKLSERFENWWNARAEESSAVREDEAMEQLSMIEAMERRDDALAEVAETHKEWTQVARAAFVRLPDGWSGIGEDLARELTARFEVPPPKKGVMGAFVARLAKDGLLIETGELRKMTGEKSNARRSFVWRKVAVQEQAA